MANPVPQSGEWVSSFDAPTEQAPVAPPPAPKPQPKLCVVLPFIETDIPQVARLLEWCRELSGPLRYSLFLLPFKGINFTNVQLAAEKAFGDVQIIQDSEGVISDWKEDAKIRDAAGPNSMFRQAAWYFYFHSELGPWLYLEPDCVPLTKDWLQQLETDHRESGMPISGVQMTGMEKPNLNGVAIYPQNLIQVAPDIVTRVMWQQHNDLEIAFDIAGGQQVLSKAHLTDKIKLTYRARATVVDIFNCTAVLFHGDRDGTLLSDLREAPVTNFPATEERCPQADPTPASPVNATKIPSTSDVCRADKGVAGIQSLKEGDVNTTGRQMSDSTNGAVKFDPLTSAEDEVIQILTVGERIRCHVDALVKLENGQLSRHMRILDALRKAKLVPRARPKRTRQ